MWEIPWRRRREVELVLHDRAADIETRGRALDAIKMVAPYAPFGERIVEAVFPLVAAATGFGGHHAGSELSILRQIRHHRDLDRLDTVDRKTKTAITFGLST